MEKHQVLTVLVADDEPELLGAVCQLIDWESLGFRLVGRAGNGLDALQMVEALPRGTFLFHRTQFPMKKWVQKICFLSSVPIVYFRPATEFCTLPSPDFSLDRSYNKIHVTYMITPTIAAAANVIGRTF